MVLHRLSVVLVAAALASVGGCGTGDPGNTGAPVQGGDDQGPAAPDAPGHDESGDAPAGELDLPPVASLTAGEWLRGDLHIHSDHSADASNNPITKITGLAESVGMDFLGLSDHDNHVEGAVAEHTWSDPAFVSSPLIMLYGAEWTTHRGHGNTFSARPYDHQQLYDLRDDFDARIAAFVKEAGIHLSANHPGNGDSFSFSYDMVHSIEVWNSAIWATNEGAVTIWDDLLKSGRDLTGRGGSDSHHGYPEPGDTPVPNSIQAGGNNVGTPTTWVFATERSAAAVVEALTNGRVSISANPHAPRVEFTADVDGDGEADMMMGDNIVPTGDAVTFHVELLGGSAGLLPYTVQVVRDGADFTSLTIAPGQTTVTFVDNPPAGQRSYYRVEVTGLPVPYPEVPGASALSGNMIALSNPIYFNFDPDY